MIDVVITTPTWRRGAQAAVDVFKFGTTPNWDLINRAHAEFQAGFNHRWSEIELGGLNALDA